MKRVIDVSETLYNTCKRLVSEGDPRPSESCIANSEPYEERPQGEWKLDSVGVYCSECKMHPDYSSSFCPNCGADMRGGAE